MLPTFTAFLNTLVSSFRANKTEILAFGTAVGETVVKALIMFLKNGALVVDIILSIGRTGRQIAQNLRQNFGEQIRVIADVVLRAFAGIVEAVSLVGVGVGKLISITTGSTAVEDFFNNINDAAEKVRKEGIAAIDDVSDTMSTFVPVTTARDAVNQFVDDFTQGAQEIKDRAVDMSDGVTDATRDIVVGMTAAGNNLSGVVTTINTSLASAFNTLNTLLGGAGTTISEFITEEDVSNLDENIRDMITSYFRLELAADGIKFAFEDSLVSVQEYNAAIRFLTNNYEDLGLTAARRS